MAPGLLMFAIDRIKSESPMSNPLSNIPKLHAVVNCFLSSKFANLVNLFKLSYLTKNSFVFQNTCTRGLRFN